MNRQRKTNRGLPRRVYIKFNAYYYVAPEAVRDPVTKEMKKWVRLCSVEEGEVVMLNRLANLLGSKEHVAGTMPHLCAEFKAKKLRRYTKQTQDQYAQYLDVIADEFEAFLVIEVTTKEFADFLLEKFGDKPNTARKYAALASKLFRYAVSGLGQRQDNPIDQLDLSEFEVSRREVLATHDQIAAIRAAGFIGDDGKRTQSGPMFACIIDMTYLMWARAVDIRMLEEAQIEDHEGGGGFIRLKPSKTKKSSGLVVDIVITPDIREVIERARAIKRANSMISRYLFPTRKGTPYTKSGLTSMWERGRDRAMAAARKEGRDFGPNIQFKDLRSLGATDAAKSGKKMEEIQKRLVHTSSKTSEIYIKEAFPDVSAIDMKLPWKTI
ncbi:tyrosine-type recombinase/integrase [uncultured Massilia sp.]|uniref:tyrosine-type recombinase/integrase n=1 Tax=uncultured Massilia sp. TaxID=169973 RepID=UPI0025891916|nr:tyrosine-type recombinase/integrase [uncultured Massilia sp.]